MIDRSKLLSATREAVQAREKGETQKSGKLFGQIKTKVDQSRNSPELDDQQTYVGIMGEIIIQGRHEGKQAYLGALKLAMEVYNYAKEKGLNNPSAIRGVSNTLMNMEAYELAEKYLREMLALIPEGESARKGDTQAHLASCLYRTARPKEAEDLIDKAIGDIEVNTGQSPEMNIAVWKSHALVVKAMITNSQGNHGHALTLAKEANDLARKH